MTEDQTERQPWHEAHHRVRRAEEVARDSANRVLDEMGLPSIEEIEEKLEEVAEEVGRRLPAPTEVLDPWDVRHRVEDGVEWVEDQLEPLRDKMEPVRDRIDELRRQPPPTAPDDGTEGEDDWGVIEWALFLLVVELLRGLELSREFDIDRALWSFDEDEETRFDLGSTSVFVPPDSFAARLGDPLIHGGVVAPGSGSPNVFIGGRPALRICDVHVCTQATPNPHANSGFRSTYGGVQVNGFSALRVGDYVDEGPHGLNPIVAGCPSVTIGPVAPPVECWSPQGARDLEPPATYPFRWRKGEMGHFKGKIVLGVDFGGAFLRVEGTVTAARLWAEETATVDIPLGDIDGDGKDEVQRITTRTKTERALGVNEVEIEIRYPSRKATVEVRPVPREDLPPPKTTVEHHEEIVELP